jgi:hypothetical protein
MSELTVPVSDVISMLEARDARFPSREELLSLLREWPGDEVSFGSSHSASLARSLEVKYKAARNLGVGVQGLEETLVSLRTCGKDIIKDTLVEGENRFFLAMLDEEMTRVLGLIRVLPLLDGQPSDADV